MGDVRPPGIPVPLEPPLLLGRYRVTNVLSRDDVGNILKAIDTQLGRDVAIKAIGYDMATVDPPRYQEARRRFANENRIAARIGGHPNIVNVYDFRTDDVGNCYLVTEYVAGTSLRELLQAGPLLVGRAVAITIDIAHGLRAAHARGIIHCALQPSRIMITTRGRGQVTDFGLAVVAGDEHTADARSLPLGTPAYTSPEQQWGAWTPDARSDLYSLGAILSEMLTGQVYARTRTPIARVRPDLPPPLIAIVDRLLAPDPEDRFPTAGEVARALEHVPADLPSAAVDPMGRPLILGRYRVEGVLGRGGFGEVVKAYDTRLKTYRAIKTLRQSLAVVDPTRFQHIIARFEREAEASTRMGVHRNVVTVHDFERDASDTRYLIMEYVPGGTLRERLRPVPGQPQVPLPAADALRIAADVAHGLYAAHMQRVVHRDVKPANIFLAAEGQAKIGDFGIAQMDGLTIDTPDRPPGNPVDSSSRSPYTPLYASPEQIDGKPPHPAATDQFSLGLVLFEILTGQAYQDEALTSAQREAWLRTIPVPVRAVIARMTAPDPAARYAAMDEAAAAIEGVAATVTADAVDEAIDDAAATRVPKRKKTPENREASLRNRRRVALAAVGGFAIILTIILMFRLLTYQTGAPARTTPTASLLLSPTSSPATTTGPTLPQSPPATAATPTPIRSTPTPQQPAVTTPGTRAWGEPRGLMTLRYPAQWSRDQGALNLPDVLHLTGPDGVEFIATIVDPQQGTVDAETDIIRKAQMNDTARIFRNQQVTNTMIDGEPARLLAFDYIEGATTSNGIWWVVNHEGREFAFVATTIGQRRAEVDALVASINLTIAWTDSMGQVRLQYPSGWKLTQNQSKENVLQLVGPSGVALFLFIFTPPGGTPESEIQTALDGHKNDTRFVYQDGTVTDVRIGLETGKTFSYTAASRANPTTPPSDGAIWEVNHQGSEYTFVAGNIGDRRTEIDAIIASVTFLH